MRWFKVIALLAGVQFVVRAAVALGRVDSGHHIAEALVTGLGSLLVIGVPAYLFAYVRAGTGMKSSAQAIASTPELNGFVNSVPPTTQVSSAPAASVDQQSPASIPRAGRVEQTGRTPAPTSENDLYERVAEELDSAKPARAVWTRAFAESDGDENRTKALYIRLRVAAIRAEEEVERADKNARAAFAAREKKDRDALLSLEESLVLPMIKARRDSHSSEAARFRAAVRANAVEEVLDLLKRFPHFVHMRTAAGESMLLVATTEQLPNIVGVLLQFGARDVEDERGVTALAVARARKQRIIIQLLEKAGVTSAPVAPDALAHVDFLGSRIIFRADGRVRIAGQEAVFESSDAAADAVASNLLERRGQQPADELRPTAEFDEERRRYDALPRGHCPNCRASILLSTEECHKCGALFTPGSVWKVEPCGRAEG